MPSLITGAQFVAYHDWRWIAKNIVDGTAVPTTQGAVAADPVVATAIARASDMLLAAAAIGKRYTVDDIVTYGGELMVGIVADLAAGIILKRRDRASEDLDKLSLAYKEALDYLELLRRGERIFYAVPFVPEAGLPGSATMIPTPPAPPLISQNTRIFGLLGADRGQSWGN